MDIFIGSSTEQFDTLVEIAHIIESYGHRPIRWDKPGLFKPGTFTLSRLVEIAYEVDAAIIIFAEDDQVWYRQDITTQPRDNVILEQGIFTGVLGIENAIIIRVGNAKMASDLHGITFIDYSEGKKQLASIVLREWIRALKGQQKPVETNRSVSDYFYTLDTAHRLNATFVDLIHDAKKVYILGRTSVNLLGSYDREIIKIVQADADVRLLFVGAESDAVKYIYGNESSIYFSNAKKTYHHLTKITKATKKRIQVKTIKHAPTVSIIYVEKNNGDAFVVVQFYFLHSKISRDRPMFRLNKDDDWFAAFKDEFDKLWDEGDIWSFNEDNNEF